MKNDRPLVQCDLEGHPIKEFPSVEKASKTLLVKQNLIWQSLNGKKEVVLGKWKFRYAALVVPGQPIFSNLPTIDIKHLPALADGDESFAAIMASITPDMIKPPSDQGHREVFADLSQNPDRWLTPFERILSRRPKKTENKNGD